VTSPLLALAAAPLPDGRIREAAERALADPALQRALPVAAPPHVFTPPSGPIGELMHLLLWAGVLVLAGLAVAWLARRLAPGGDDGPVAEAEAGHQPVSIPTAGATALAAEGRYAEAIHVLLLDTLAALSRAASLAPSLTSREIVALAALPEQAREALAGLVAAVEVSRFGGAEPGRDEYQACLARFDRFLASYRVAR
jgi:hypothetical protein